MGCKAHTDVKRRTRLLLPRMIAAGETLPETRDDEQGRTAAVSISYAQSQSGEGGVGQDHGGEDGGFSDDASVCRIVRGLSLPVRTYGALTGTPHIDQVVLLGLRRTAVIQAQGSFRELCVRIRRTSASSPVLSTYAICTAELSTQDAVRC